MCHPSPDSPPSPELETGPASVLSLKGMAVVQERRNEQRSKEGAEAFSTMQVDIFNGRPTRFTLQALPCKVVYYMVTARPSFFGSETRRCGLRLDQLSPMQTEQLEAILARCEVRLPPATLSKIHPCVGMPPVVS